MANSVLISGLGNSEDSCKLVKESLIAMGRKVDCCLVREEGVGVVFKSIEEAVEAVKLTSMEGKEVCVSFLKIWEKNGSEKKKRRKTHHKSSENPFSNPFVVPLEKLPFALIVPTSMLRDPHFLSSLQTANPKKRGFFVLDNENEGSAPQPSFASEYGVIPANLATATNLSSVVNSAYASACNSSCNSAVTSAVNSVCNSPRRSSSLPQELFEPAKHVPRTLSQEKKTGSENFNTFEFANSLDNAEKLSFSKLEFDVDSFFTDGIPANPSENATPEHPNLNVSSSGEIQLSPSNMFCEKPLEKDMLELQEVQFAEDVSYDSCNPNSNFVSYSEPCSPNASPSQKKKRKTQGKERIRKEVIISNTDRIAIDDYCSKLSQAPVWTLSSLSKEKNNFLRCLGGKMKEILTNQSYQPLPTGKKEKLITEIISLRTKIVQNNTF